MEVSMPFRPVRMKTFSACLTLISGLSFTLIPNPPPQRADIRSAEAAPGQKTPSNIIAVDRRIAKRLNALRPCVKERLVRVARKLPRRVTLLVTSAHRTREEQASLRSTFGVKARPGTSPHEDGRAIDVNVLVDGKRLSPRRQHKVIGPAMASEGFRYLGPRDPVHYSIPREETDPTLAQGPDLQVMTMQEMLEAKEQDLPVAEVPQATAASTAGF
jgi:hypothetical protein